MISQDTWIFSHFARQFFTPFTNNDELLIFLEKVESVLAGIEKCHWAEYQFLILWLAWENIFQVCGIL